MQRMKRMTTEKHRHRSWLRAVAEAAKEQGIPLPSFTGHAMGGARSLSAEGRTVHHVQTPACTGGSSRV